MARTLNEVEQDIRRWIRQSSTWFDATYVDVDRVYVVKFFAPRYLAGFMRNPALYVSTTPGFTWGDGVYAVPISHVYSAMIYGRVGVMGWVSSNDIKNVYDASSPRGIELYQEWIQFKPGLYRLLTTTVHSQQANRALRNVFKRKFDIDLVAFKPDEYNRFYVKPATDRWFAISDFSGSSALAGATSGFSPVVRECELVAFGIEEFEVSKTGFVRESLLGPTVSPPTFARLVAGRPSLESNLKAQYIANRSRGTAPPTYIALHP